MEPFLVEDLGLVGHEPADTVSLAWVASAFDDEAAAVGCALWRVRDFGWEKEEHMKFIHVKKGNWVKSN